MRWCNAQLALIFFFGVLPSGALAQCKSGAEARVAVEKIEAKPIPSVVANSSSGAHFVIESSSNQIDIAISNSSAAVVREFTSQYTTCTVSVLIKGILLESELMSNFFPLSSDAGFTRYLGLTIPKEEYSLQHLNQIVDGEKIITLKIK